MGKSDEVDGLLVGHSDTQVSDLNLFREILKNSFITESNEDSKHTWVSLLTGIYRLLKEIVVALFKEVILVTYSWIFVIYTFTGLHARLSLGS